MPCDKQIVYQWSKEVIDLVERGFMWSWNDANKKHIFGFITDLWRKVQAYHVNCTRRRLFPRLFPLKGVKTIHIEAEDVAALATVRRDKLPTIWTKEIL